MRDRGPDRAAKLLDLAVQFIDIGERAVDRREPDVGDVIQLAELPEDEVADVRSFQVGIMPLPDDPWTRGKCTCKILQYFAASLPVVCSPVGANG